MTVPMLLADIPSPTVSYIHVGPFTIRFYAIIMMIATWIAVTIIYQRWKRREGTFDQITDIAVVAIPCGLIGARLYNCLTVPFNYFPYYGGSLINILKIWDGGMAIFGALIGGYCGAALMCHRKHLSLLSFSDAAAPALLVAQSFGRLGNWFNQELYGAPTTLPWGLKLNQSNAIGEYELCYNNTPCPNPETHVFQPTFLYSIIWCMLGVLVLLLIEKKYHASLHAGQTFAIYLMWYGIGRAAIEHIRINASLYIGPFRINTLVALIVFVLGLILFIKLKTNKHHQAKVTQ